MALDIGAKSPDTRIIETSNRVPNWPLKVLYDANGVGKRICEETEIAYKNGPAPLPHYALIR